MLTPADLPGAPAYVYEYNGRPGFYGVSVFGAPAVGTFETDDAVMNKIQADFFADQLNREFRKWVSEYTQILLCRKLEEQAESWRGTSMSYARSEHADLQEMAATMGRERARLLLLKQALELTPLGACDEEFERRWGRIRDLLNAHSR